MRRLPPLHALRAFEAAARHLHFADAAAELGLTPTAISHQVRHLEQLLGVQLFQRYPRPIRLTPQGAALFPALREALDQMAAAVAQLHPAATAQPIRLSVTMAFAGRWLMPRLPLLRQETGLTVQIEADDRPVDLHASGTDMAIRYAAHPGPGAEWHRLFGDRILPVGAPGLLRAAPPLTPRQILAMPLLDYRWKSASDHAPGWGRWLAQAGHGGQTPAIAQSFSEETHAMDAAAAGQGAVLASERLVAGLLADGTLIRLSDIALPGLSYWAVFRDHHPQKARLMALRDWFRQQA